MKSSELSRSVLRREGRGLGAAGAGWFATPEVDIYEAQDELLLVVNLPGVPREGVTVSLEGSELTIEGKRAPGDEPKGEVVTLEASCSNFLRTFVVPPEVDPDGIRAEIENGVLRVHLPKVAPREPRSIPIKAR